MSKVRRRGCRPRKARELLTLSLTPWHFQPLRARPPNDRNPRLRDILSRADDGSRTRDLRLGKPTLYQLSYVRAGGAILEAGGRRAGRYLGSDHEEGSLPDSDRRRSRRRGLVGLLAYGLASERARPRDRARARRGRAQAGARPSTARARRARGTRLARRLPRARSWCSTSGPRGACPAARSRRCSSAGTGGSSRRRGTVLGVDVLDVDLRRARLRARLRPDLSDAARQRRRTLDDFGVIGYPETFVIDRQRPDRGQPARPGRRGFMRRAASRRCCEERREARARAR